MTDPPHPGLSEKRKQWLEVLSGEDRHSISRQLTDMIWDAASFRMVNEARRLAPPDSKGGVQLNWMMHSLMDRGFFASQILAIRRLTDSYSLEGPKGVYSLSGLLKDMQAQRHLLTRAAVFAAEGLAYDYEPIRRRWRAYADERRSGSETAWATPADLDWHKHERRHEAVDMLTGVRPEARRPEDVIQEAVLVNLASKVARASKEIVTYAKKFIAHAATPESRAIVNADDAVLTLNHLWEAHKHLCQVAKFLAIEVLGDSCPGLLRIPLFNQFRHMDKPLIDSSRLGELRELWKQFEEECQSWKQWDLDTYRSEFGDDAAGESRS